MNCVVGNERFLSAAAGVLLRLATVIFVSFSFDVIFFFMIIQIKVH